ncbi:hypothetical protein AIIKEEIJ_02985 [Rhodococcus sp. YH1]|nr:hypothetical protein [Rhodococcus sp. YH1]
MHHNGWRSVSESVYIDHFGHTKAPLLMTPPNNK